MRPDDTDLRDMFNKAIAEADADGTYKKSEQIFQEVDPRQVVMNEPAPTKACGLRPTWSQQEAGEAMDWFGLIFGPNGWGGLMLEGAVVTILLAVTRCPSGSAPASRSRFSSSPGTASCALCEAYTTFFRGIPDLLSLFIVYFGLQALVDRLSKPIGHHIELSAFFAGVIALSVVVAAYSSEVWVAALQGVPRGQHEAAHSLGLDRGRPFFSS